MTAGARWLNQPAEEQVGLRTDKSCVMAQDFFKENKC
jgi:hypothetical protein